MSRPNRCINYNGEELWISRSTVVIPVVFKKTGDDIYALIEKRGKAVSHSGEWCCPCGFLDWDEDFNEACQREVMEETGLELDVSNIKFFDIRTDKFSSNQTIDLWHECWTDGNFDMDKVETKDEILDLHWLKVATLKSGNPLLRTRDTLIIYKWSIQAGGGKWAFKKHPEYIIRMLKSHFQSNRCVIKEVDE